jgi:beta-phosphoglucomutase family hydrolase
MSANRLGLPASIAACLFDLDGVITQTAKVHDRAWKEMFDAFLKERAAKTGEPFVPFDENRDYIQYVDGKPRVDGVRSFLESRHIQLDESEIHQLAARKDKLFLDLIHRNGVEVYEGTIRYLHAAREAGLKLAVVSSSKNTTEILRAAKLEHMFDGQVDGVTAEREHLKGKPAPDTYLRAATLLHTTAPQAAVYEDALAGVEAGRAGGFGVVVGVDRDTLARELYTHGADLVVSDLAELLET